MKLTRKRKPSPAKYYVCFVGDRRWPVAGVHGICAKETDTLLRL